MKKAKQIGYLSAVMMIVASTIGAGIFFKNGSIFSNADGKLGFMISSWIVAGFGIMAIGLSLVELSSASKTDGGIMEWIKKFAPKKFSKYSASYMVLIYLPLNYFAMPAYAVNSLLDAIKSVNGDFEMSGWSVMGISILFLVWFAGLSFYQQKASEKVQIVFGVMKYAPLLAAPIFSLFQVADNGVSTHISSSASGLTGFSPWLGIMASIPAILFAVDGFYTVTSLKSELKDEKKLGSIVAVGIALVMSTYLIFAIILGLSGTEDHFGLDIISNNPWVGATFNSFIAIAVLSILNGFALATPKIYHDTFKDQPIGLISWYKKAFKIKDDYKASFIASLSLGILFSLVLGIIGTYAIDTSANGFGKDVYDAYGSCGGIFQLADFATNFTSMVVFIFIGFAIFGGILNRKTNKVKVEKSKYFLPVAWISVIFLAIGGGYLLIASFVDMFGVNGANETTSIIKFAILAFTSLIAAIPLINFKSGNVIATI